jgi:predicted outer membrane protein
MRRRGWVAAGLLFLAACRPGTSNDRSAAERRPPGETIPRSPTTPEREAATARALAAMRVASRSEIEMAKLVGPRASSSEVKEYAARIVAQRTLDAETLARLAREQAINLGAIDADPSIQAELATGRDLIDRLTRASGPELEALYLMFEAPRAMRLSRLADQAEGLARDPESAGSLRQIGAQARDAQARAFAVMPRECGGQRDVKPAAAPHAIPAIEDRGGHADAGAGAGAHGDAGADAGSPRPRGSSSPSAIDL